MYTNFVYLLFLLFVLEFIVLYVGAQDKNIAYSAGSQPEFSFRQQDKARLLIHWNIRNQQPRLPMACLSLAWIVIITENYRNLLKSTEN